MVPPSPDVVEAPADAAPSVPPANANVPNMVDDISDGDDFYAFAYNEFDEFMNNADNEIMPVDDAPPPAIQITPWVPLQGDLLFANMGEEMNPVPSFPPLAENSDDPGELLGSDVVTAAASSPGGQKKPPYVN